MNKIHDTAIIGPGVKMGKNNIIGPGAVLFGPLTLGDGNWIGPNAAIGTPGEVRGGLHEANWENEQGVQGIYIGNNNVIREFVTVQQPYYRKTKIGNNCFIMTKAHVPHDGIIEDEVTISCSVLIGGHSIVMKGANLGLGSILHPYSAIGSGAMIGMGTVITKDVPPFGMAYGVPGKVRGANERKMARIGYESNLISEYSEFLLSGDYHLKGFPISQSIDSTLLKWRTAITEIQLDPEEKTAHS